MQSDYIKIAVSNILNEASGGIERSCGSCNPSCDDLTRFICFGHTSSEISEWINNNADKLKKQYEDNVMKLYEDCAKDMQVRDQESKMQFAKSFCLSCPKFINKRDSALETNNSIFDAVIDVEAFQSNCIKTCEKFIDAFMLKLKEDMYESYFSL